VGNQQLRDGVEMHEAEARYQVIKLVKECPRMTTLLFKLQWEGANWLTLLKLLQEAAPVREILESPAKNSPRPKRPRRSAARIHRRPVAAPALAVEAPPGAVSEGAAGVQSVSAAGDTAAALSLGVANASTVARNAQATRNQQTGSYSE
jgi:hypothetical protein